MKLQNGDTILAGMAEVSVREFVALEKSVNEKDQTIGALREQIKNLERKIEDVKAEAIAKQGMVIIQKGGTKPSGYTYCQNCNYYHSYKDNCPNCGTSRPGSSDIKEYKNLDSVIEEIRKDEAKKLGLDFAELDRKINELSLEKTKTQNTLNFKVKELEEFLKEEKKEKDNAISTAKEKIRKHMTGLIDQLNEEIEDLREEVKKTKKDKTDEQVEEARKQEIIDLKERIAELEKGVPTPEFGWFKGIIYKWLDVDGKAKVKAEQEQIEKRDRIDKISNNYPKGKSWWAPNWAFEMSDPWNW